MEASELDGRSLALAISNVDDPEEEGLLLHGTMRWDGDALLLARAENKRPFPIPEGAIARIQPVTDDIREVVGSGEYWVLVRLGNLPEDEDAASFEETGFNWNELKELRQ